VIFAGTPEVALPTLKALDSSAHEVVGILTRRDAPVGRSQTLSRSPVAQWGDEHAVPVLTANRPDEQTRQAIAELAPEIGVIVAYGALLDAEMLTVPTRGWINLHFSDLPKYRGAAPVQRALLLGESDIATTVFQLVEAMDAGPLFDVEHHPVAPDATSGEVLDSLAHLGAHQVVRVLNDIAAGGLQAREQDGTPSFAPKITTREARLDPREDVVTVVNHFRAVTPEPGAWLETTAGRVKVSSATALKTPADIPTGVIAEWDGTIVLGCRDGALVLERVIPAGRRDMLASDWFRGIRTPEVSVVHP
jgi:methionyl-tRNA formyltransferase